MAWISFRSRSPAKAAIGFQDQDISSESGRDKRGRPTIRDNFLLGGRNAWICLLEESWPEIGWPLTRMRNQRSSTIEDVRQVLMALKGKPNGGLAGAFYRETTEVANATEIRKNRLKLSELHKDILETQRKHVEQQRLCAEAEAALQEANPNDNYAILAELDRRKELLLQLEEDLKKAENDRNALDKKSLDQEAYFCRTELLDFIHSIGRYAVSPRNLACALAGLPQMGWRQSYDRCSKMSYAPEPHLWYRVFQTIEEIWNRRSGEFAQAPIDFFRTELLSLPKKHGYVRQFLWDKWRDLRLAIEESWEQGLPTQSIPFVITSRFVQNLNRQKGPVEKILADREKLVSPNLAAES